MRKWNGGGNGISNHYCVVCGMSLKVNSTPFHCIISDQKIIRKMSKANKNEKKKEEEK